MTRPLADVQCYDRPRSRVVRARLEMPDHDLFFSLEAPIPADTTYRHVIFDVRDVRRRSDGTTVVAFGDANDFVSVEWAYETASVRREGGFNEARHELSSDGTTAVVLDELGAAYDQLEAWRRELAPQRPDVWPYVIAVAELPLAMQSNEAIQRAAERLLRGTRRRR